MSAYSGIRSHKSSLNPSDIQVVVDNRPLTAVDKQVPGSGNLFGWGSFSTWANKKLLAISILVYEMHNVMKLSDSVARQRANQMYGMFVDDRLSKWGEEWSISSKEIQDWMESKFTFW